jgi:hypothetical protein
MPMSSWTPGELGGIDATDELQIASRRDDGTLRDPVTIWVVRHGDDVYVRAVNGRGARWFRGAQHSGQGHIEAGGVGRDVTFAEPATDLDDELDAAYRAKYRRYAPGIVGSVVTQQAREATIRLVPA